MTAAQPEKITIKCKCGGRFRVPATAVGKKVKCPKCNEVVRISAPRPKVAPVPTPLSEDDDFLSSLGEQESEADALGPPLPAIAPRPRPTSQRGAQAAAGLASGLAKSTGAFAMGVILSAVGGFVGGLVWYLIAVGTDYEIGYVALGVGFLAGAGMIVGYRQANAKAGLVAALIAVAAILGAKFTIFTMAIDAYEQTYRQSGEYQTNIVQSFMSSEILAADGIDAEKSTDEQWDAAWAKAEEPVAAMSEEEVRAAYEEIAANNEIPTQVGATDRASGLMSTLGPFDALWLLLAIAAAWRLGNNGFSGSED